MDLKYWLGYLSEWLGVLAVVMIAGTSPLLKKRRPLGFRYPNREATYALSLFAVVYIIAFQYFSGDLLQFLREFAGVFPGGETAERMLLAVIALIPFILAVVLRGQPLKSMGWQKENLRAGLIVGLLLIVVVLFLRGKFAPLLKGVTRQQAGLLPVWLIYSFAEETIFRGYIQMRLDSYLGAKWGWMAAAGLFLLWQLPGRLWLFPAGQIWQPILIAAVQGVLCGWTMKKTGHVAAPALYRAFAGWLTVL
jgi:membrane protease YdiL (CAAX protease family)